jgi:mannose-1-phosphate guanylyltransferase/phosphomannomutase
VSQTVEAIAHQYGGQVLRTRVDMHAVMEAAAGKGVIMATDGAGGFVFPQFHPAVDGLMALAKLLEFLAVEKTSVCEVMASLPPQHMAVRDVSCPWEAKGTVMRMLHERYKTERGAKIDGVRVQLGHDWVLVLPDPDQPLFRIYSESDSTMAAEELAEKYARIVESLQK